MVRNKLRISKEWNIQPSEIDRLAFYEYEQILEEINIIQKEEEKRQKEENKQYNNMNPKSMMSSMRNSMPSFNTNSFKMPTVSMPKF